jgi:type IV pilus assembly protein PilZ
VQERRKHVRKPVSIPVALLLPDRVEVESRDLSLGGIFISGGRQLPYGAKLTVVLKLPGLSEETQVEGTVRWAQGDGLGIQFGMMGARETAALLSLLKD